MFIILLTSIVSVSNYVNCISLRNQKCMTQPILNNLHCNEYSQKLSYYLIVVNLDKRAGSCNTFDHLSNRLCVSSEIEDLNLHVFSMITKINESRTLIKHISCKYEYKFDSKKCNSNQKWNNDKCWCESKNSKELCVFEKYYIWNPATCSCKNGLYSGSIIGDSVIICDEIIKETKAIPAKRTSTKTVLTKCTSTNFYILLAFLSLTIALLIAVSSYCCFVKYQAKQNSLLPQHYAVSKLKEKGY